MQGALRAGPIDWREFHATVGPGDELIGWTLWARLTYVSGTTVTLRFFDVIPQTKRLGNMTMASQLPQRVSFAIAAIRVIPIIRPFNASAIAANDAPQLGVPDDIAQIVNEGVLDLTILNKPYYESPIFVCPSGTGVVAHGFGVLAATDIVQTATFGNPDPRAVQTLSKPLAIPPQTNFNIRLDWDAALTLDVGNTDIVVMLDGEIIRPQQ